MPASRLARSCQSRHAPDDRRASISRAPSITTPTDANSCWFWPNQERLAFWAGNCAFSVQSASEEAQSCKLRTGSSGSSYYDKVGTYFAVLGAALASDLIQFSFPERLRLDARSLEQAIFNPRPSGPKEYK